MKPASRKSAEEKISVINADALKEIQEQTVLMKLLNGPALDDADLSTQSGGSSRRSSWASEAESPTLSAQEVSLLPGSTDEISMPSDSPSKKKSLELPSLPGAVDEISMSSLPARKSELDKLAVVIADRAQSKFSGRVYEDVRNAFLAVDSNGDGKLTQAEAVAFCQHFDLSSETALHLFTLLDRHDSGLGDWSSFLVQCFPVFSKKSDFKLNAGPGRKRPAIQ